MTSLNMAQKDQPGTIEQPQPDVAVEEELDQPWHLILYNDEVHTFDEVINQLVKALKCPIQKAKFFAIKAHNEGKATVYKGSFEECFQRNSVLQEIQLVTEIKG